jgi:hypothetical protein
MLDFVRIYKVCKKKIILCPDDKNTYFGKYLVNHRYDRELEFGIGVLILITFIFQLYDRNIN